MRTMNNSYRINPFIDLPAFFFIHIEHFSLFEVVQLSLTHAGRYFTLDSRDNTYEIRFLKELLFQQFLSRSGLCWFGMSWLLVAGGPQRWLL